MRPSFFIFALPRSGSSWLSVFLTGPHSYCYHEPTADRVPLEWARHARSRPESIIGGIDTGAYRYARTIRQSLPHAKFFALLRDPLEVSRSTRWLGIDGFDAYNARAELISLGYEPIEYTRLGNLEYLKELWEHIVGISFDEERAQQLIEMRIERDIGKFIAARPNSLEHYQRLLA